MFKRRHKKERLQIHDLQPLSGERGIDKSIPSLPRASLQKKAGKTLQINLRILPAFFCGEGGSRTFRIMENHKIPIHCKLSVYKIVKFVEVHRVHFDI